MSPFCSLIQNGWTLQGLEHTVLYKPTKMQTISLHEMVAALGSLHVSLSYVGGVPLFTLGFVHRLIESENSVAPPACSRTKGLLVQAQLRLSPASIISDRYTPGSTTSPVFDVNTQSLIGV